jgi:excisionase family DNA binding protein
MQHRWLTIREAAQYLRMSVAFLRKCVRQNTIPHTHIGSKALRFDRQAIEVVAYLAVWARNSRHFTHPRSSPLFTLPIISSSMLQLRGAPGGVEVSGRGSVDGAKLPSCRPFGVRRDKPACCRGCKSPTGKETATPSWPRVLQVTPRGGA